MAHAIFRSATKAGMPEQACLGACLIASTHRSDKWMCETCASVCVALTQTDENDDNYSARATTQNHVAAPGEGTRTEECPQSGSHPHISNAP
jgi:hypothetical protein